MENKKYLIESFNEFIGYAPNVNEKESGVELSINNVKDLINEILQDNIKLALKFYSHAENVDDKDGFNKKRDHLRYLSAKELENGNPMKGALYLLLTQGNEKLISNSNSKKEIIAKIGINVDSDDFETEVDRFKETIPDMEEDEVKELIIESIKNSNTNLFKGTQGLRTNILWSLLSAAEQEDVYKTFEIEARKRGYETVESVQKKIEGHFKARFGKKESKFSYMRSPGIDITTEKDITEIEKAVEGKKEKTLMLSEDKMSDVFKQNMTGENGKDDFIEEAFDEIVKNMGSIFRRIISTEITGITKINILTSCDRYRNTESAENISWGQLAYARALAMKELIRAVAEASGIDPKIIEKMHQFIYIYDKGYNGDGTSGPNPPEGFKFGYYVENNGKSTWVDGKNRSDIIIIPVDEEGTPKLSSYKGSDKKTMDPLSDKPDYNEFRYNNIEIEYEISDRDKTKPRDEEGKVIDLTYPVIIKLPALYRNIEITVPIPTFGRSKLQVGKLDKHGCSKFDTTTKSKWGFGMNKITVAKFKTD